MFGKKAAAKDFQKRGEVSLEETSLLEGSVTAAAYVGQREEKLEDVLSVSKQVC